MREPDRIISGDAFFGHVIMDVISGSAYIMTPMLSLLELREEADNIAAAIEWYERRQADSEVGR